MAFIGAVVVPWGTPGSLLVAQGPRGAWWEEGDGGAVHNCLGVQNTKSKGAQGIPQQTLPAAPGRGDGGAGEPSGGAGTSGRPIGSSFLSGEPLSSSCQKQKEEKRVKSGPQGMPHNPRLLQVEQGLQVREVLQEFSHPGGVRIHADHLEAF